VQALHRAQLPSAQPTLKTVPCIEPATPSVNVLNTYIVEDSPLIRENLIATLEELVPLHVVGTAEDEDTAVHWLGHPDAPVDLVIVDLFLKGGSGLGVLRAAQSAAPAYRLIVLSNYATPDMRRTCLALGAHRVFDKSNEIDALIDYCADLAAAAGIASKPPPGPSPPMRNGLR
jgi:DNA-binding NarL/FixJ family response regulator